MVPRPPSRVTARRRTNAPHRSSRRRRPRDRKGAGRASVSRHRAARSGSRPARRTHAARGAGPGVLDGVNRRVRARLRRERRAAVSDHRATDAHAHHRRLHQRRRRGRDLALGLEGKLLDRRIDTLAHLTALLLQLGAEAAQRAAPPPVCLDLDCAAIIERFARDDGDDLEDIHGVGVVPRRV